MTDVQYILLQAEIIQLMQADGFIAGTPPVFVAARWQDATAVSKLAGDVVVVLKKYGVPIPPKVDAIVSLLPLILALAK